MSILNKYSKIPFNTCLTLKIFIMKICRPKNLLLCSFFLAVLFSACSSESFTTIENGIVASIKTSNNSGAKLVRIEVINENIIRVSASPEEQFPGRESLVILPRKTAGTPFTIEEKDESVVISTDKIMASLSLRSGEVQFTDTEGRILLQEKQGGGKTFVPISVDDSHGYTFRQVFESPSDEAFYGLGQHQSDEWNYKGKNEILYQYNTKVSVPFIVSNRNYGILWDNYSLTKFGDPGPYKNLNSFTLYDKEGKEGGLTATYITAEGETFVRQAEEEIDYENLETIGNFPKDFPSGNRTSCGKGRSKQKRPESMNSSCIMPDIPPFTWAARRWWQNAGGPPGTPIPISSGCTSKPEKRFP